MISTSEPVGEPLLELLVFVPDMSGVDVSPEIVLSDCVFRRDVVANYTGAVAADMDTAGIMSGKYDKERMTEGHYTFSRIDATRTDGTAVFCNDGAPFRLSNVDDASQRSAGVFRYSRVVGDAAAGGARGGGGGGGGGGSKRARR